MRRRCAWCGTVRGEDHREPVGAITDGICPECTTKVLAKWDAELQEAIDIDAEDTKHAEEVTQT